MAPQRICTISGCGEPAKARDWCQKHYNNWYRHGDPNTRPAVERVRGNKNMATPVATRFWSKVDFSDPDGCWPWRGSMRHRYGETFHDGVKHYTHRIAYELVYGDLAPDEVVAHHCDNPPCVRPDHLFATTQAGNMADCSEKERWRNQFDAGANHPIRSTLADSA